MSKKTSLAASSIIAISFATFSTPAQAASIFQKEIFGIGQNSQDIYRIDLSNSTVTNLGSSTVPFFSGLSITNLAMSPNRDLYFMNPFEGNGGAGTHRLYKATLNPTNTALTNISVVVNLPTAGLGVIDGFTIGPDGNLYMTGYGKSEIYRYNFSTNILETAVRLVAPSATAPKGQFRSDLAFDPFTGNLVGLGIEPGTSDRTLFEIPASLVLTGGLGINPTANYVWNYFGGNSSAWATKVLNIGSELGGNPDGIAFDPTNGDLYMSGDGTGIYQYDRTTAVRGSVVPGTAKSYLNGIGWDLAFQTREIPIQSTPEPASLVSLLLVGGSTLFLKRRA